MNDIELDLTIMYICVFISCSILWCSYCLIDYAKCKRKDIKSDIRIKSYPITILFGVLIILIIELAIIFIPFPTYEMDCIQFVNESEYIPNNDFTDFIPIPVIIIGIGLIIIFIISVVYSKLKKKRKFNESI